MWFRIIVLALGTFALGTDSFVIAGVLPDIANGLHISLALAGLAVTAFALIYAFGAPILAALAGSVERRRLLLVSLLILTIANVLAALAPNFTLLLVARILAALGASLYTPTASAVAATLAPEKQRGRALAIVMTGLTAATVLGVPLGVLIGSWFGWQATLLFVALLSLLAFVGVLLLFPQVAPPPVVSLRTRLAFLKRPEVLLTLVYTFLVMAGMQIIGTYQRPLFQDVTHANDAFVSVLFFLFGLGGVFGSMLGGYSADRWGNIPTVVGALLILSAMLLLFPWVGTITLGAIIVLIVWSAAGWMINPAQQNRLVSFAPQAAGVVISLNSSALYLGLSFGSALGSLLIQHVTPSNLCRISGTWELATVLIVVASALLTKKLLKRPTETSIACEVALPIPVLD